MQSQSVPFLLSCFLPGIASNFQGGYRVPRHQEEPSASCINEKVLDLACSPGSMPVAAAAYPSFWPLQVGQPSFLWNWFLSMKADDKPAAPLCHSGAQGVSEPLSAFIPAVFFPWWVPTMCYTGNLVNRLPGRALYGNQCPCSASATLRWDFCCTPDPEVT